jgi:serine/threonine protein kinase/tetratricopeptide (TPR) repeat protein
MTTDPLDRLRASLATTYDFERELGGGGMSRVFVAADTRLGRKIVVKVLNPELAEGISAQRFEREILIAARLQHPNIVPVLSTGESEGLPFYTMPFVRGESLRAQLSSGRMNTRTALRVLADVARALAYAHDEGVVHRDIKPENVLIADGMAVVTDFGIAKAIDAARVERSGSTLTEIGRALGTPAYMAPEQAAGDTNIDQRADLYAWGVLAYECLTHAHPFADKKTARALITAHLVGQPTHICERAEVSAAVADIVMRCLAKDPDARPSSARALLAVLEGSGEPVAAPSHATVPSIAILPFVNLSADPDNEYFSDGITEEILNVLAQDRGLRVAARSSSFAFKGQQVDLQAIAERLHVSALLEGSVRRAGNRVRVTAQLVSAHDGYQLWSDHFDRELTDIFAIQDEIASAIAVTLRQALYGRTGVASDNTAARGTTRSRPMANIEAYESYLKGRFQLHRRADGMHEARAHFERALALEPDFAEAHAGLANSYLWLGTHAALPPADAFARMRRHAEQALSLDPDLPDAHYLLGYVALWYDWDPMACERHVRRALALQANNPDALLLAAYLHFTNRRPDNAQAMTEAALQADPIGLATRIGAMSKYYLTGEFKRAIALADAVIEEDPMSGEARRFRAMSTYTSGGDLAAARSDLEEAARTMRRSPFVLAHLVMVLSLEGKRVEAERLRDELVERAMKEAVPPVTIALAEQALGDYDSAFAWYERALDARDFLMVWLHVGPMFRIVPPTQSYPITEDPRWVTLVRRVGVAS